MTRKEFAQHMLLSNVLSRGQDYNRGEAPAIAEGEAMHRRCTYITRLVATVPDGFFDDETVELVARQKTEPSTFSELAASAFNIGPKAEGTVSLEAIVNSLGTKSNG
jgi:hypothetical protein